MKRKTLGCLIAGLLCRECLRGGGYRGKFRLWEVISRGLAEYFLIRRHHRLRQAQPGKNILKNRFCY